MFIQEKKTPLLSVRPFSVDGIAHRKRVSNAFISGGKEKKKKKKEIKEKKQNKTKHHRTARAVMSLEVSSD